MAKKPTNGSIYRPKYRYKGQVVESKTWWLKYYVRGAPVRESAHTESWEEANRTLKRKQGEAVTGRFAGATAERIRMGTLFEAVEQDYIQNERSSLTEVKARIKTHLAPVFGQVRAADLSTGQLRAYIKARQAAGAANSTVNRETAIVSRAFRLAAMEDPPLVVRIPHIPKLPEDNVREGFIEYDQYVALKEKMPPHLKCLLVVAYHLGMRLGELRKLRWDQVDLKAGQIRLSGRQTKNKHPRTAPIYGDMPEWLKAQKEERDRKSPACPSVFHYCGRRLGSHLKGWATACTAAGMPRLLFHDLRRSAVRNMERAGVPRSQAKMISGHRTDSVYQRYDIVSQRDIAIASAKMQTYLDQQEAARAAAEQARKEQGSDAAQQIN